jgi:hypothetical protein
MVNPLYQRSKAEPPFIITNRPFMITLLPGMFKHSGEKPIVAQAVYSAPSPVTPAVVAAHGLRS